MKLLNVLQIKLIPFVGCLEETKYRRTNPAKVKSGLFGLKPVVFVPFSIRKTRAVADAIGWFKGSFLIAICLVCQASFADQPATPISMSMPNIKIHQPINSRLECGLSGGAKNLSFSQSANFSIANPPKTMKPPTTAQNNTATSPSESDEGGERKAFIRFWSKCMSSLAVFGIICAAFIFWCRRH